MTSLVTFQSLQSEIVTLRTILNHMDAEIIVALNDANALSSAGGGKALTIPYLSQFGLGASYAPGDCGAACAAMIANWRGHACTVDEVGKAINKPSGYLFMTISEVVAAAGKFGVVLVYQPSMLLEDFKQHINAGLPVVALVNYQSIPATLRREANYDAGHYILVVGYDDTSIIYHDPDWLTAEDGANKRMLQADFVKAFSTAAPGNSGAKYGLVVKA